MHFCEECGQACYCDWDDIPMPVDLAHCDHVCDGGEDVELEEEASDDAK